MSEQAQRRLEMQMSKLSQENERLKSRNRQLVTNKTSLNQKVKVLKAKNFSSTRTPSKTGLDEEERDYFQLGSTKLVDRRKESPGNTGTPAKSIDDSNVKRTSPGAMKRIFAMHRRAQSTRDLNSLLKGARSLGQTLLTPTGPSVQPVTPIGTTFHRKSLGRKELVIKNYEKFETELVTAVLKYPHFRNSKEHVKIVNLFLSIQKELNSFIAACAEKCTDEMKRQKEKPSIVQRFPRSRKFLNFLDVYVLLKKQYLLDKIIKKTFKSGGVPTIIGNAFKLFVQLYAKNLVLSTNDVFDMPGKEYSSKKKTVNVFGRVEGRRVTSVLSPGIMHKSTIVKKILVKVERRRRGSHRRSGSSSSGGKSKLKKKKKSSRKLREELMRDLYAGSSEEFREEVRKREAEVVRTQKETGIDPKKLPFKKMVKWEFVNLKKIFENISPIDFSTVALSKENLKKNRYTNILPYDFNLLTNEFYVNANPVNLTEVIPEDKMRYFVGQYPLRHTEEQYWLSIMKKKAYVVLNLQNTNSTHHEFWPKNVHRFKKYKAIIVGTKNMVQGAMWDEIKIEILTTKGKAFTTTLVNFKMWKDHGLPKSPDSMLKLIQKIQTLLRKRRNLFINCSAGIGRTGVFIAIYSILKNELGLEKVNPIVKCMRKQRNGMVQTLSQYQFVYDFVKYMRGEDSDESESESDDETDDESDQEGDGKNKKITNVDDESDESEDESDDEE